jgi:hypothetical protein
VATFSFDVRDVRALTEAGLRSPTHTTGHRAKAPRRAVRGPAYTGMRKTFADQDLPDIPVADQLAEQHGLTSGEGGSELRRFRGTTGCIGARPFIVATILFAISGGAG